MFKKTSPLNFRRDVNDVIVLITDGVPRGKRNSSPLAKQYAKDLKNRKVLIVTAGVGRQSENANFQRVLMDLATSPDFFIKASFNQLGGVVDKVVEMSCIKPGR